MAWVISIFSLCILHLSLGEKVTPFLHPDTGLNAVELIESHGYPIEEHSVTTSDGYILGVQRIPYGTDNENVADKPVVLLMHGLASSSADFVSMGPNNSLGFLLAELGYDVWLANARGNSYSRSHVNLDPSNNRTFWDFSWDEIGTLDLPATIDYILETTGQEKLFYIGHGQGTTAFFVLTSEIPAYNDKIRAMVALSPIAYMDDFVSPIFRILSSFNSILDTLLKLLGVYEIGPRTGLMGLFGVFFCDDGNPYQDICADLLYLFNGYSFDQMNASLIPVIFSNNPDGAALKQYVHFAQEIVSGHFRKYDFGSIRNLIVYRSVTPPDYDISQITAPVALFFSLNDWMASATSVERLAAALPNVISSNEVEDARFNHIDYLFGTHAKELVYDVIFEILATH